MPDALEQRQPHVDWRGVADIGNVLGHAYDQVIDREVWETATQDLGSPRRAVAAILNELAEEPGDRNAEMDTDPT